MRKSFKVYKYTMIVDGVAKDIETSGKLDYKKACRKMYLEGAKSVRFEFNGTYIWAE